MSEFPYNMKPAPPPPPKPPGPMPAPRPEDRPATRGDMAAVIAELKAIRELLSRLADRR